MATQTRITAEEFFDLRFDDDAPRELVFGEVVVLNLPGPLHGIVAANVTSELRWYLREQGGGRVMCGTGFVLPLADDLERVRGPDVSFVAAARFSEGKVPKFFRGAPDLAIEVLSPSNQAMDVQRKIV